MINSFVKLLPFMLFQFKTNLRSKLGTNKNTISLNFCTLLKKIWLNWIFDYFYVIFVPTTLQHTVRMKTAMVLIWDETFVIWLIKFQLNEMHELLLETMNAILKKRKCLNQAKWSACHVDILIFSWSNNIYSICLYKTQLHVISKRRYELAVFLLLLSTFFIVYRDSLQITFLLISRTYAFASFGLH